MASSDWTALGTVLGTTDVARGVSQAFTPPNGGSSFVRAVRSRTNTLGVYGEAVNGTNFYPTSIGCSIRGAIKRVGNQYATIMLFGCLQSNASTANGYLLGLTHDEEPSHLVLVKGPPSSGLLEAGSGVLAKSVGTYAADTWVHLKLDIIEQPHGDVHLQVFENDLTANAVGSPVWAAVSGMDEVIDDSVGQITGSLPYTGGGYGGWAYYTEQLGRYALIDHAVFARQL